MLRNKPKLPYCGLSVILSNPSRFDKDIIIKGVNKGRLLTATGGEMFNNFCLRPEFNQMQCDIRLADDPSPLLEGTRCLLLLGEYSMHKYAPTTRNNSLNEMRGSPLLSTDNIPAIASYYPQDAIDIKNYEAQFNEESKEFGESEENQEDDGDEDVKTFSKTKRSNYAFWLRADTRKCKSILSGFNPFKKETQPTYRVYPSSDEVINILRTTKNQFLYFDIETDYEEQNLLCFSFSFDGQTIYSVPVLNHEYKPSYSSLGNIMLAFGIAIRDNVLVAHNGASFDFFVLGYKYNIPVYRCYDTMIAMHRCFPDIEKSLGHCVSYWTWEVFHKDSDSHSYFTQEHVMTKLKYCAKDVYTMFLVHKEITKYAKTIPGLEASINCAMRSIRPYLICGLQGISYSTEKVEKIKNENDRLMTQYIRVINLMVGQLGLSECRKQIKGGKAKALPSSNTQCVHYFHELLGYPVIWRSKKTGKPSLAAKHMYKLRLKFPDNPVITFILMYRSLQKEYSTLKFNPWKDDENKICSAAEDTDEAQKDFAFGQIVPSSLQAFISLQ